MVVLNNITEQFLEEPHAVSEPQVGGPSCQLLMVPALPATVALNGRPRGRRPFETVPSARPGRRIVVRGTQSAGREIATRSGDAPIAFVVLG